jgi:hypothetical protein
MVKGMAAELIDDLRNQKVDLVAKSHSTISIGACSQLLGLSHEQTVIRCQSLGWTIDGDFIKPVKSSPVVAHDLNAHQLQALTGTSFTFSIINAVCHSHQFQLSYMPVLMPLCFCRLTCCCVDIEYVYLCLSHCNVFLEWSPEMICVTTRMADYVCSLDAK